MRAGVAFALAAGMVWGLIFICPLILHDYPALMLAFGRHVAFGLIAVPLAWHDRHALARLGRADWIESLRLALIGNLFYYVFLASAIQRVGAPLPSMITGALPVVIPIAANLFNHRLDGRLSWRSLAPSLILIALGLACVNEAELLHLAHESRGQLLRHASGAALAIGALALWAWYAIRNANWLRTHADFPPRAWSTAYGLCTLPPALLGFVGLWGADALGLTHAGMPLGPRPALYLALMLGMALIPSWLGMSFWNAASKRLPTSLMGQLTIFESLAGLAYAFLMRGTWPPALTLTGVALLIAGVLAGTRACASPAAARPAPAAAGPSPAL